MRVEVKEFTEVLDSLSPGLSKKGVIEQMQHYHFFNDMILTYNDRILVSAPFETGVQGSVDAQSLFKILSGITEKEAFISSNSSHMLIQTNSLKIELSMISDETAVVKRMSEIWETRKDTVTLPQDFNTGLNLCCQNSLKSDKYHPYSQMVKVEGRNIVCLQTLRGSWFTMRESVDDSFYIPVDCSQELIKFNLAGISLKDSGWKTFEEASGIVVMCVTTEIPNFPKYREAFKNTMDVAIPIPLTAEIAEASSLVGVMGEGEVDVDKKIAVKISGGGTKMELIGSRVEGRIVCSVNMIAKEEVEDFQFKINPDFLKTLAERGDELLVTEKCVMVDSPTFKHMCLISMVEDE